MDKTDRAKIDRCVNFLTSKIDMKKLWPKLVEKRVFNPDDCNALKWEENLAAKETVREILLTVKTRGPNAFTNLVLCLRETKHHTLATVLQGYGPSDNKFDRPDDKQQSGSEESDKSDGSDDDMPVQDDHYKNFHVKEEPLTIKLRKATKFRDGPEYKTVGNYPMRSRPRGYVLIITIRVSGEFLEVRKASERDEACLVELFQEMGFEVTPLGSLSGKEILEAVEEFSKKDFRLVDSCFVIISAHGLAAINQKGFADTEIMGRDFGTPGAKKVFCNDIIDFFTVKNCPFLKGKPKIFIFQACRGGKRQEMSRTVTDGADSNAPPRNYSDIMIAHSTMYGYVAYRDNVSGSWYIQILCEVFMNYAHKLHVQELFQQVDRRLAEVRTIQGEGQTSTLKLLGFNKHCYLNPGLFED